MAWLFSFWVTSGIQLECSMTVAPPTGPNDLLQSFLSFLHRATPAAVTSLHVTAGDLHRVALNQTTPYWRGNLEKKIDTMQIYNKKIMQKKTRQK